MALRICHWQSLEAAARADLLRRPALHEHASLEADVAAIISDVRARGDAAVADFARRHDGVELSAFRVTQGEFAAAEAALGATAHAALDRAIENVRRFHEAQRGGVLSLEISPGVLLERRELPLRAVGLYVPAGSAPLPSTAIMVAVPAAIAGCPVRVLCTPPRRDGSADPAVLVASAHCGVTDVFKIGGAQAIAAMAYGTASVPKVDKIFGPGSAWVTAAKLRVAADPNGAAFDLPAGPSEVLVIADEHARPELVAADLLAQAEHDPAAQVLLVTPASALAAAVVAEVERQRVALGRQRIIERSLAGGRVIVVPDLATAFEVSNAYAPEHLILQIRAARAWLPRITVAGTVFLGEWSPEAVGDYCSGANHVLPTYGYARAWSGLGLADFQRRVTVQELTPAGLRDVGPVTVALAALEGLDGHANSVRLRLTALDRL